MQYNGKVLRHELKFYINYNEYMYLKNRLKTVLTLDENSSRADGYNIRSLYFDDLYNSALKEKEAGIFKRQKYRIRAYNFEDKIIKLERKEKYGELISKESMSLTKEQFYDIINRKNIDFLINSKSRLFHDIYVEIKTKLLRPVVIVDYVREAYTLEHGNVRITFDKKLQAGINTVDMFSSELMTVNALPPHLLVLEVKYDDYLPQYIRQLIQISSHNRSAISKYVICRKLQYKRNGATKIFT